MQYSRSVLFYLFMIFLIPAFSFSRIGNSKFRSGVIKPSGRLFHEFFIMVGAEAPVGTWSEYFSFGPSVQLNYVLNLSMCRKLSLFANPYGEYGMFLKKSDTDITYSHIEGGLKLGVSFLAFRGISFAPYIGGGVRISSVKTQYIRKSINNFLISAGIRIFYEFMKSLYVGISLGGKAIYDKDDRVLGELVSGIVLAYKI